MSDLHWFHGIGWDTSMRDIGWTYVFMAVCLVGFVWAVVRLVKEW